MAVLIVVWVALAVLIGIHADSKGRSGLGFGVLAFVISPLLAWIIVLCVSDLKKEEARQERDREDRRRHEETIAALMQRKD